MPLSSIAKAEAALQKTVHLSRGGLCAEFTAEDIRRISDGDVLRYLSTYSSASAESDGGIRTAPAERPRVPVTTAADMEAHMAALQEEINTFITVVDNEGCSYEIRVGASGHVQVPIEDNDLEDGASLREVEGEMELVPAGDAALVASPDEGAARTEGGTSAAVSPLSSEATPTTSHPPSQRVRRPPLSKPVRSTRSTAHHSARVHQVTRFSKSPPPTRLLQSSRLSTARLPAFPVRPQASLTDSEATRVEHLLDPSATAALMANLYVLGAEKEQRLRALEAEARRYAAGRGAVMTEDALKHLKDAPTDVLAAALPKVRETTADLGNAYMRYAREHEKMAHQLRSVNERLRALQRRAAALALAPADDVPSSVAALRPSWAQTTERAIEEEQVQRLLELAREEEARAKEAGLNCVPPPAPDEPFSALRRHLGAACTHAADLLATYESTPLVLRSPVAAGAEDADDSDPEA
ncbi:conserved hypothetical protein [Leishmania major strain Friedlin]|uniref:Uncharacterized protein n=1 Tax=Leishmania major TaxID=5664 RepID=Q4QFH7_LEIMA|nr:conserved hypothetical protein [Leishmania major strain Friedlin]CAG9571352.1 hypothetical_protein_-_conserved [Leishmania major strain Friedlin]CAJ03231.1 conserved hypothetical protein [Leishmania major strain Friedlin]|eukprot:XP_001681921.1 conserved hypothetical protein [Leishmania major strain Friedlin]